MPCEIGQFLRDPFSLVVGLHQFDRLDGRFGVGNDYVVSRSVDGGFCFEVHLRSLVGFGFFVQVGERLIQHSGFVLANEPPFVKMRRVVHTGRFFDRQVDEFSGSCHSWASVGRAKNNTHVIRLW